MLVCMVYSVSIAEVSNHVQKPHLEIKCYCGANFVIYEWLDEILLARVDKFIEKHPCAHNNNKEVETYYPVDYQVVGFTGTTIVLGSTTTYININDTGIKKLIGKIVHRIKPCVANNYDRSYMSEPRKLLNVTDEYLILSSDILAEGKFKIERNEWDDGNWEEWRKSERLSATEMIGSETFHIISYGKSQYHCVICGGFLRLTPTDHYCLSCKTGWDIKDE